MSFFFNLQKKDTTTNKKRKTASSLDLCYKHGCTVCPKNKSKSYKTPKMDPTGSSKPVIYILGEAPSKRDDTTGKQFSGKSGLYLMNTLKDVFGKGYVRKNVRKNFCARCPSHPPTTQEIMCCRSSVEKDIAKTKPDIIIGPGYIPLNWMVGESSIGNWRGRRVPVKIGDHTAWYFPILNPEDVLKKRGKYDYETEYDEIFKLDLENINKFLSQKVIPTPRVISEGYTDNIHTVTGRGKNDLETVKKWLDHLKALPVTALDIETSGLKPWQGHKLLTIAIGTDKETYSFPVEHPKGWKDSTEIKELLKDFLLNSGVKVAHNLKFELTWFLHYFGAEVLFETEWADTMSQAYVLDERTGQGILSLDILCLQYFGFNLKSLSSVDTKNVLGSSLEDVLIYNGMDTKYTYKLFISQSSSMPKSLKSLEKHHNEVCKTLAVVETRGVIVNPKTTERICRKLQKEIDSIEKDLYSLPEVAKYEKRFGEEFNFASSPKLVKMLRDVLKLPQIKKTKNKENPGYSTDKEVLQEFAKRGIKLPVYIEKLREAIKLKSTYADSILELVDDNNTLRASFNSCRTATGRFSSNEPNMQNFPKRKNAYVRKQVIAPKGYVFVAVDYGQLEARVISMASGETNIIEHDVHADWSRRIIKAYPKVAGVKHLDDISPKAFKDFRSKIKNALVFPWFYGAGTNSVGSTLGLPKSVAAKLHKEFNDYFSRVKVWQDKTIAFYKRNGYVIGLTGRRRRAPLSRNQLLNNSIQGCASDIVVASMNRLSRMSYETDTPYLQPILNIHDDLSFYIPEDKLEEAVHIIAGEMVRDYPLMNGIPLEVEVMVGKNWYALEEYGTYSLANLQT